MGVSIREITSFVIRGVSSDGYDFETVFDVRHQIPNIEISYDTYGYAVRIDSHFNSMDTQIVDAEPDCDSDALNSFLDDFQVKTEG